VISTVILARLLTPADFGVVTMVTTFSLLLVNFGFNGFTEGVIQFEEIDRYTASNLFWLNSGPGWCWPSHLLRRGRYLRASTIILWW
jgi:PST family polysaccharide transporter